MYCSKIEAEPLPALPFYKAKRGGRSILYTRDGNMILCNSISPPLLFFRGRSILYTRDGNMILCNSISPPLLFFKGEGSGEGLKK
jgi:hypothetical protein